LWCYREVIFDLRADAQIEEQPTAFAVGVPRSRGTPSARASSLTGGSMSERNKSKLITAALVLLICCAVFMTVVGLKTGQSDKVLEVMTYVFVVGVTAIISTITTMHRPPSDR
jgi:hypothetical protein